MLGGYNPYCEVDLKILLLVFRRTVSSLAIHIEIESNHKIRQNQYLVSTNFCKRIHFSKMLQLQNENPLVLRSEKKLKICQRVIYFDIFPHETSLRKQRSKSGKIENSNKLISHIYNLYIIHLHNISRYYYTPSVFSIQYSMLYDLKSCRYDCYCNVNFGKNISSFLSYR